MRASYVTELITMATAVVIVRRLRSEQTKDERE